MITKITVYETSNRMLEKDFDRARAHELNARLVELAESASGHEIPSFSECYHIIKNYDKIRYIFEMYEDSI